MFYWIFTFLTLCPFQGAHSIISIDTFGRLLGQLQAEGTKSGKRFNLEFGNKLISEHLNFRDYLEELGIQRHSLLSAIIFHPSIKDIPEKIKEFEQKTSIPIIQISEAKTGKGGYAFKTFIRSKLITEIILNSLDILRKKLAQEPWDKNLKNLADAFFAKLLTGDGTLDRTTNNREYDFPEARIKITDGNISYLKDYAKIMKKLGFKPHINESHISVRSYAGFDKLLYLYKIKAFQNTPNWKKLILLISENLKGRRLCTSLRFVDFLDSKEFTSKALIANYGIKLRTANDWLNNKKKEGLAVRIDNTLPIRWKFTPKAEELASTLSLHRKDLAEINKSITISSSSSSRF